MGAIYECGYIVILSCDTTFICIKALFLDQKKKKTKLVFATFEELK